ncbi:hypothetical protein BB561_003019 [Smittium simulii]|uniref:Thioredoxin domain-containing protein n=1 Tax=Smittium simulii TaxID=133385 RepID=A0A2T9YNG8_9FUNG|nr:hypothetical protein BB561_003019 [Smittium simulii]
MRLKFLGFLSILTLTLLHGTSGSQIHTKLDQINALKDDSHVAKLDEQTIQDLVFTNDKSYHVLLLFSTSNNKAGCLACSKIQHMFDSAAKSWKLQGKSGSLIFASFEIFKDLKIPEKFGITLVPEAYFIPPSSIEYNSNSSEIKILNFDHINSPKQLVEKINLVMGFDISTLSIFQKLAPKLIKSFLIGFVILMCSGTGYSFINSPIYFYEEYNTGKIDLFQASVNSDYGIDSHQEYITKKRAQLVCFWSIAVELDYLTQSKKALNVWRLATKNKLNNDDDFFCKNFLNKDQQNIIQFTDFYIKSQQSNDYGFIKTTTNKEKFDSSILNYNNPNFLYGYKNNNEHNIEHYELSTESSELDELLLVVRKLFLFKIWLKKTKLKKSLTIFISNKNSICINKCLLKWKNNMYDTEVEKKTDIHHCKAEYLKSKIKANIVINIFNMWKKLTKLSILENIWHNYFNGKLNPDEFDSKYNCYKYINHNLLDSIRFKNKMRLAYLSKWRKKTNLLQKSNTIIKKTVKNIKRLIINKLNLHSKKAHLDLSKSIKHSNRSILIKSIELWKSQYCNILKMMQDGISHCNMVLVKKSLSNFDQNHYLNYKNIILNQKMSKFIIKSDKLKKLTTLKIIYAKFNINQFLYTKWTLLYNEDFNFYKLTTNEAYFLYLIDKRLKLMSISKFKTKFHTIMTLGKTATNLNIYNLKAVCFKRWVSRKTLNFQLKTFIFYNIIYVVIWYYIKFINLKKSLNFFTLYKNMQLKIMALRRFVEVKDKIQRLHLKLENNRYPNNRSWIVRSCLYKFKYLSQDINKRKKKESTINNLSFQLVKCSGQTNKPLHLKSHNNYKNDLLTINSIIPIQNLHAIKAIGGDNISNYYSDSSSTLNSNRTENFFTIKKKSYADVRPNQLSSSISSKSKQYLVQSNSTISQNNSKSTKKKKFKNAKSIKSNSYCGNTTDFMLNRLEDNIARDYNFLLDLNYSNKLNTSNYFSDSKLSTETNNKISDSVLSNSIKKINNKTDSIALLSDVYNTGYCFNNPEFSITSQNLTINEQKFNPLSVNPVPKSIALEDLKLDLPQSSLFDEIFGNNTDYKSISTVNHIDKPNDNVSILAKLCAESTKRSIENKIGSVGLKISTTQQSTDSNYTLNNFKNSFSKQNRLSKNKNNHASLNKNSNFYYQNSKDEGNFNHVSIPGLKNYDARKVIKKKLMKELAPKLCEKLPTELNEISHNLKKNISSNLLYKIYLQWKSLSNNNKFNKHTSVEKNQDFSTKSIKSDSLDINTYKANTVDYAYNQESIPMIKNDFIKSEVVKNKKHNAFSDISTYSSFDSKNISFLNRNSYESIGLSTNFNSSIYSKGSDSLHQEIIPSYDNLNIDLENKLDLTADSLKQTFLENIKYEIFSVWYLFTAEVAKLIDISSTDLESQQNKRIFARTLKIWKRKYYTKQLINSEYIMDSMDSNQDLIDMDIVSKKGGFNKKAIPNSLNENIINFDYKSDLFSDCHNIIESRSHDLNYFTFKDNVNNLNPTKVLNLKQPKIQTNGSYNYNKPIIHKNEKIVKITKNKRSGLYTNHNNVFANSNYIKKILLKLNENSDLDLPLFNQTIKTENLNFSRRLKKIQVVGAVKNNSKAEKKTIDSKKNMHNNINFSTTDFIEKSNPIDIKSNINTIQIKNEYDNIIDHIDFSNNSNSSKDCASDLLSFVVNHIIQKQLNNTNYGLPALNKESSSATKANKNVLNKINNGLLLSSNLILNQIQSSSSTISIDEESNLDNDLNYNLDSVLRNYMYLLFYRRKTLEKCFHILKASSNATLAKKNTFSDEFDKNYAMKESVSAPLIGNEQPKFQNQTLTMDNQTEQIHMNQIADNCYNKKLKQKSFKLMSFRYTIIMILQRLRKVFATKWNGANIQRRAIKEWEKKLGVIFNKKNN